MGSFLSIQGYKLLTSSGINIETPKSYEATEDDVPWLRLCLPHLDRSPQEFESFMTKISKDLPSIGDLVYLTDFPAVDFRSRYGFSRELPLDRVSGKLNPIYIRRVQSRFYGLRRFYKETFFGSGIPGGKSSNPASLD